VIVVRADYCDGCGACMEVCPTGALYLVEGKATVETTLCSECEACLAACPSRAITLVAQEEPVAEAARLPALRPEPEVIRVRTLPRPASLRSRARPVVGVALAWAGREILRWLADVLLYRQTTRPEASAGAHTGEPLTSGANGGGQQHRHRRRGGRS
jgi:NAD-dependent dihydropyrimidine dehydrogenase PreA subunit